MDERVDVLNDKGEYTGSSILKSDAHKLGLWHPTIHLWCYDKKGFVLLQQRGAHKDTYPLKWDVSVAGHVESGEAIILAAIREAKEEIGIDINTEYLEQVDLITTEKKHHAHFFDREFTHIFLYPLTKDTPLKIQPEEVEAINWIPINQLENEILENNSKFIEGAQQRLLNAIAFIKSRLD